LWSVQFALSQVDKLYGKRKQYGAFLAIGVGVEVVLLL
jgi:hypothetical protein